MLTLRLGDENSPRAWLHLSKWDPALTSRPVVTFHTHESVVRQPLWAEPQRGRRLGGPRGPDC